MSLQDTVSGDRLHIGFFGPGATPENPAWSTR